MEMDRGEIVVSYRTAANKRAQLGVLAELNLCSKAEIAHILQEAWEKVDGRWYTTPKAPRQTKARRDAAVTAAPAAREEQTAPAQHPEHSAAPAQQAASDVPEGVTLSRAEAAVLREYLESTLPGWFRVMDVEKILTPDVKTAQLLRVNTLTGIWKKLTGGDA